MSEVASSMYLHSRLPMWCACARLVLSEGRPPDVRHVAIGEAERCATKRAVVDNMTEADVSVLAPS